MPDADGSQPAAELATFLEATVREAGELALKTFRGPLKQWIKGASSPVCEADIAVDLMLRDRLTGNTSRYGWLSEETEDDPARLDAESIWIVDPIDGTRSYLAGLPDWVVSVALATAGRPVVAAIFAPVTDEFFIATAGSGATRNEEQIAASVGEGFDGAKFAGPKGRLNRLVAIAPRIEAAPRIGSLALRLARVATGELDGALAAPNSHDWDLAAADLLVHEAGGALTTLAGRFLIYNRPEPVHGALVAAGRGRHAKLIELLGNRRAEFA